MKDNPEEYNIQDIQVTSHETRPKIANIIYNPFYKNTAFIILNIFSSAFFGLLFWLLAARFYSSEEVGLATALISSAAIIWSISSFGLGTGLIRFLPGSNEKSLLFSSVWTVSLISSLVSGVIFLLGIGFFSPALKFLMTPWFAIVYLFYLVLQMNNGIENSGLLGLRKAEYSFIQNLVLGFRIILLIPLAFSGVIGIIGSLGIALTISSLIGIFILYKQNIAMKLVLNQKLIKDIANFSLANYTVDFLSTVQTSVLPILILNVVGAKEAAYFYVAFSIASLLYAIPSSVFMSMFIEGSHGEPLRNNLIKSLATVGTLMIPAGIIIYFYGDILLSLFSEEYSDKAYEILKLLVLSGFFVTFNGIFTVVKKIQKDMKPMIIVNVLLFIFTIFFSYIFMRQYGIFGVGLGWITGQGMTSALVGIILWMERRGAPIIFS
jgi:O-antigen/teichoic acid export membrane protein